MADNKIKAQPQPGIPDPYNMDHKRKLNPKADERNYVGLRKGVPTLLCGAVRKGKLCAQPAGFGTDHTGHGRCKFHGGCNTGPTSEEGKAKAAQNSRKHGLYSEVLPAQERETYENLVNDKVVTLEHEIFLQKAKILSYLAKWKKVYEDTVADLEAANPGLAKEWEAWTKLNRERQDEIRRTGTPPIPPRTPRQIHADAEKATRVYKKNSDGTLQYYHAGSIEDDPLNRALETLGRMVARYAQLTQGANQDPLTDINNELRAASRGKIEISWGGPAQSRGGATNEKPGNEPKGS